MDVRGPRPFQCDEALIGADEEVLEQGPLDNMSEVKTADPCDDSNSRTQKAIGFVYGMDGTELHTFYTADLHLRFGDLVGKVSEKMNIPTTQFRLMRDATMLTAMDGWDAEILTQASLENPVTLMFYRLPEEGMTLENEHRIVQELMSTCEMIRDQGVVATVQVLRDRLPRLDRCMRPLHHLIWSGCLAIAIYCLAHYGAVWATLLFKISFLFSLLLPVYLQVSKDKRQGAPLSLSACWWCLPATVIGTPFVFILLLLLWPAAMLTAALLCVLYLFLPERLETIPDTVLYLVLTPLFALLACSRFCGTLTRPTRRDGIVLHV